MGIEQFLIICIVPIGISTSDRINLPCSANSDCIPGVFWPDIDHGTCSASIPGCTDSEGHLDIRCCEAGEPSEINCVRNDTIRDPRCLGNMSSTIGNSNIEFCFEFVNNTKFPFECVSKTGLMIPPKFDVFTKIAGNDTGIWLPMKKYDSFRYITVSSSYMDPFGPPSSSNFSGECVILIGGTTKFVSCSEHYLGICLDFPFIIYKVLPMSELDILLFEVKDFCDRNYNNHDFCSYFRQKYHMNLVYFSSRSYVEEPYIILQKSNLRLILQIRKDDLPEANGTVHLHVGLASSDWDIFKNTSFPLTNYFDTTDETLFMTPRVILSAVGDTISIVKNNSNNIKWTQKEEYTHYIFCFFSDAAGYHLEKFEVLDNYQIDLKNKNGIVWCDAFDYDLNIISSNVISSGNQDIFYYISEITVSIEQIQSCNISTVREKIISSIILSKGDEYFYFDTKNISVPVCDSSGMTNVNILVYWYPKQSANQINEIEEEYTRLKKVIRGISRQYKENHWNISSSKLRHSNFCLKESRAIGNFSFVWSTTASSSNATSFPYCYKNNGIIREIVRRNCSKGSSGSFWSTDIENCEPDTNLTQLLQEIYLSENVCKSGVLNNLNMAIRNYHQDFRVHDVDLVSKILRQLNGVPSNIEHGLKNLSLLINNLNFIKADVLKISQHKHRTTDNIMNSSDTLYVRSRESPNFAEANHCYYTINFTENPNATGIILRVSGNSHETILLESALPPTELLEYDNFEATIFFNEKYLNIFKENKDAIIKFSIFFNNYLFDVNHPSLTTRTIFKVLIPEDIKLYPFTTFLTMNKKGGEVCACWKDPNADNNSKGSKWLRTAKFETESLSSCIFRSASYCSIFSTGWEETDGYVSRILVQYSDSTENLSYFPFFIIDEIFNLLDLIKLQHGETLTYEVRPIRNISHRIIEIVVFWILESPAQTIPEIEKEYIDLKFSIGKLSTNFSKNNVIDWMDVEYFRHRKYCLEDTYEYDKNSRFIFRTIALHDDAISSPICYTNGGVLRRKCIGSFDSGSFWEDLDYQSFENCFSNVTESLNFILQHFNDTDANKVLNDLEKITEKATVDFNAIDINLLSEILFLIGHSTDSQHLDVQSVSAITSNIQEISRDALRNAQLKYNATDKILDSLDRILSKSNITINKKARFCTVPLNNLGESDALILQNNGNDYKVSVVHGAVNNPHYLDEYENFEGAVFFTGFNPNDSIIVSIFFKDVLFVDETWKHSVSLVFGILIPNQDERFNLPGEIEIVFKSREGKDRACAYWKYGIDNRTNINGRWRNESEPQGKYEFSTCKFNHTTHFAMLINDDSGDPEYLRIVTNIGCSLSIIGLFGILITGLIFERWRKNLGNIILMNFVFTVVIQICLYYFSGVIHEVISKSDSCILIGALLHYSVISEFCWMLIIAILQFKRFVQVLTRPPKNVLFKSFLGGWGFPLIPVLSVLLIDPENYTSSMTGLCYPSELGLYLAVWLPIIVITMINLIIFSYIMYSICNRKTECVDTVSNEIIFQWRLAVLLFFMLGLTWSFALFSQFLLKDIFAYLFCITATLQGFIMFLFFIVFNERTRLLYSVLFKKILK